MYAYCLIFFLRFMTVNQKHTLQVFYKKKTLQSIKDIRQDTACIAIQIVGNMWTGSSVSHSV